MNTPTKLIPIPGGFVGDYVREGEFSVWPKVIDPELVTVQKATPAKGFRIPAPK